MKRPNRSFSAALLVPCLLILINTAEGGRIPEPWDSLPQIEMFVFGNTDLGLVSMDGRHFVLNPGTGAFKEISVTEFHLRFPDPKPPSAREVVKDTGIGSEVRLRTSQSLAFTSRNAYCAEGENLTHQLLANGKPLKDFVEPCYSISAVEQIGSQLWLGTRSDGEYGDYPAEGIVIQSLDGERKIGQISSRDGLTGDLVRAIRRSPIDSLIWVATNQGVNAIASNLKIEKSIYFYQDFDPATGNPTFLISPTPHETPMIVEFARQLNLRDYKAFHDAWRSIPAKAANKFIIGLQDSLYSPENAMPGREAFAPSETSTLVPFFIEASRSPDNKTKALALGALCAMNDPRAVARFVELRSASQQGHGGFESYFIPRCLDKYAVFGLLSKNDTGGLARKLKADTEAALNTISTQRMDAYPPLPLMETVVKNAVSMKKISDPSGMNLINAYFKASDGNNRDALLYGYVGQNMMYENDIWLAMVEGLQKFHTADIARGCAYFDMRWNFMPRRYDAAVAKAILTGVSHINSPRSCTGHITITVAPDSRISLLDSCTGAFKSQLDDPATKKLFVEKYYGTLSALEKALADQMARGQSPATIH